MRPLDEKETTAVFEKLFKFTGANLKQIVERPAVEGPDEPAGLYCFRLHRDRVFYASESLVRRATNVSRERLVSIGRFTKSGQFRLTVQALGLIAAHARHKVWLKPSAENSFLYGNPVLKSHLGRITENTAAGDGVVVYLTENTTASVCRTRRFMPHIVRRSQHPPSIILISSRR